MERLEIFKEAYYKELERKNSLEDALNIPLGIISAILAAIFYFLTTYSYELNNNCEFAFKIIFFVLMSASLLAIFFSGHYIIKSYNNYFKGHPYSYVDRFMEIDEHYNNLLNYYLDNGGVTAQLTVDFDEFLSNNFRDTTTNNVKQNHIKTAYRIRRKSALFAA